MNKHLRWALVGLCVLAILGTCGCADRTWDEASIRREIACNLRAEDAPVETTPAPKFGDKWHPPMMAKMLAPAPTVKRGDDLKRNGNIVATYYVGQQNGAGTDPGDISYKGSFAESGTANGYPTYTNGSRWLWYMSGPSDQGWVLSTAVDGSISFETTAYCQSPASAAPDEGVWFVTYGTSPAPTVSAAIYEIIIDSPTEGAEVPAGAVTVSGRCTGLTDGTVGIYGLLPGGEWTEIGATTAGATWSVSAAQPGSWGGPISVGIEARQIVSSVAVATDSVTVSWMGEEPVMEATELPATAMAIGLEAMVVQLAGTATATAEGLQATAAVTLLEATAGIADATATGLPATAELKPGQNVTAGIAEAIATGLDNQAAGVTIYPRTHSVIHWKMFRAKRGIA